MDLLFFYWDRALSFCRFYNNISFQNIRYFLSIDKMSVIYHSDYESPVPRPLKNGGNTCYMNAVLQFFLSCTEAIQSLHIFARRFPNSEVLNHWMQFVRQYDNPESSTSFISIDPILSILSMKGCTQFLQNHQGDAHEFLMALLDIFHEELDAIQSRNSQNRDGRGRIVHGGDDDDNVTNNNNNIDDNVITLSSWLSHYFMFQVERKPATQPQSELMIVVPVRQTLEEALEVWFDGGNTLLLTFPIYLMILISRYDETSVHQSMHIPLSIQVKERSIQYYWKSSINHHGLTYFGGHYDSLVRHAPDQKIYLCDDHNIQIVSSETFASLLSTSYILVYEMQSPPAR